MTQTPKPWDTLPPHYRHIAETHLTPRQLQILKLRINTTHGYSDIARTLGLSPSTIRAHEDRALIKIRTHLQQHRKDAA